ncbi:MAG: flagellin [Candidatus Sumerlaeia bacterium]
MSIKINQNIFSLISRRNLEKASENLETSYQRLSSGTRLTRSADDPAAMAISEQVRYQISSLRQNQDNVSGSISLLGTAESHVSGMIDTLQRLRELAVQGASDSLNAQNRSAIQSEIDQLVADLEDTAANSQFSGRHLFNGSFSNIAMQVGTGTGDLIRLGFDDYRTAGLGAVSQVTSSTSVSTSAIAAGALMLNGIAIPASTSDGLSTSAADASAIAKATAINSVEASTGVHAEVQATSRTATSAVQAVNLDGVTRGLWINGVAMCPVVVQDGDSSMALLTRINASSNQTGVTATLDSSGRLRLEAEDGRNIQIKTTGNVADELGLAASDGDVDETVTAKIKLSSSRPFSVNDTAGALGLASSSMQVNPDVSTAIAHVNVISTASANQALESIDTALAQLSDCRSRIGAVQNRLESLTTSLATQVEDLTSTDSRISDTDFALETTRYTQAQILQEAAISILAQANTTPRRALELLQQ